MTTKPKPQPRPKFDGEKLVALADTIWDTTLLVREYAYGRASEKDVFRLFARANRKIITAVWGPLKAPKTLFKVVSAVHGDYQKIFADEELRTRVIGIMQKLMVDVGGSFTFTVTEPSPPLGSSDSAKIEA